MPYFHVRKQFGKRQDHAALGRLEQSSAQQKEFADRPWGCIQLAFPLWKLHGCCLIPCDWRAKLQPCLIHC